MIELLITWFCRSRDGKISLLKLLLKERGLALEGCKQRYLQLLQENNTLKQDIQTFEEQTHNNATQQLTRSALSHL